MIPYFELTLIPLPGGTALAAFGTLVALGVFAGVLFAEARARATGVPASAIHAAIAWAVVPGFLLAHVVALLPRLGEVDAATAGYASYYMINCAHPTHFEGVVDADQAWVGRIRGLRANASRMSHAELNEASSLDIGDPAELGADYARLKGRLGQLSVMGGCCGTDTRHLEQIASACVRPGSYRTP